MILGRSSANHTCLLLGHGGTMQTSRSRWILKTSMVAFLGWAMTATSWGQALTAVPFHTTGVYETGEKAGWTLALPAGVTAPAAPYAYTIKTNNSATVKQGQLDLSSGK